MAPDTGHHITAIYNRWYMVRHYARGGRTAIQRRERAAAIHQLGLAVRAAFNASEDFEALLAAVVDGARAHSEPPF